MRRVPLLLIALAVFAGMLCGQLKMPAYERSTLPNGVTVLTMVKKDVPLVTLRLLVKGGMESDSAEKAGLADVTNDLLLRGTKSRTAEQIALDVDFLGASIETGSEDSANVIELELLSKDVNEGVRILADLALNPTFPEDEVAKELARAIDGAKARKDRPQAAIGSYASKFFYAGTSHPRGMVADEETLQRITREDIVAYHRKQYVGSNLIVIAVGDLDAASLKSELAKAFGAAPKGTPYAWRNVAGVGRPAQARLLLVDDADSTQTFFRIMQPGIARTSPDRIPLLLVNTLFGGRFTSMLNDALRVNAGLTYGASSFFSQDRLPGELTIATFTATGTTEQAVDMALDVLNTLRTKGVSAEQLASAKAYIKGTAPTSLIETNDQLADILGTFAINGLNEAEINEFFARIDAVSPDDVKRVIDKYYRADGLTFVLLGQRSAIEKAVAKYAPVITHGSLAEPGIRLPQAK
jgi:predicted Zn-dependent peptidase